MVLAEALGAEAFRERVKIYATDVDEEALDQARQAVYTDAGRRGGPAGAAASATSSRRRRRYAFRKDLRRAVIFGRHDLDPGRADLADRPAGLPQHADVLQRRDAGADPRRASTSRCSRRRLPVPRQGRDAAHARRRCSRRSTSSGASSRKVADGRRCATALIASPAPATTRRRRSAGRPASATAAFEAAPVAQLVVDRGRRPRRWPTSRRATLFGLDAARHRPAAPGPRALLPAGRAALAHRAGLRRAPAGASSTDVEWRPPAGEPRYLDVQVVAAARRRRRRCSAPAITFHDVDAVPPAPGRARARPSASSRPRTRSCSRPTRSWRRPTRSCSRRTRSSRRPTRSCSRPTRSSRR